MSENELIRNKYNTMSSDTIVELKSNGEKIKMFVPDDMWVKCNNCGKILYYKKVLKNMKICTNCDYHFRLTAQERLEYLVDKDSFFEYDKTLTIKNYLEFEGYLEKVDICIEKTGLKEAVITGEGLINGIKTVLCIMDSHFMMGSMGTLEGEKITRAIERAMEKEIPVIIFTSSGGARMQEGIFSLMQMVKVSSALSKLSDKGIPYFTVLTDPTTGGVMASFGMLGDIILSEPKALVGFAGKRVIKETINQELPVGFQSAEFLLEHGFVDKIVQRKNLKNTLTKILRYHSRG